MRNINRWLGNWKEEEKIVYKHWNADASNCKHFKAFWCSVLLSIVVNALESIDLHRMVIHNNKLVDLMSTYELWHLQWIAPNIFDYKLQHFFIVHSSFDISHKSEQLNNCIPFRISFESPEKSRKKNKQKMRYFWMNNCFYVLTGVLSLTIRVDLVRRVHEHRVQSQKAFFFSIESVQLKLDFHAIEILIE